MKFTLSWLKDHLDTSASLDEIVTTLTMIGLEVERVEDKAKEYAPFKVAQIIEAVQHPNADRLRVCKVDNGTGAPLQVPRLTAVSFRLPLLHDGCAKTLRDRFSAPCGGGDMHGHTSQLDSSPIDDLVAYLETL